MDTSNAKKTKYFSPKKQDIHSKYEKKTKKRNATGEEVLFIFEKVLEEQRPIQIYNEIKRTNPSSTVTKQWVEKIYTGNCFVAPNEYRRKEDYTLYQTLREKVYQYHREKNEIKKQTKIQKKGNIENHIHC